MAGARYNVVNATFLTTYPATGVTNSFKTPLNGQLTPYVGIIHDLSKHYSVYASYANVVSPSLPVTGPSGSLLGIATGTNLEAGLKAEWRGGLVNGSVAWFRVDERGVPSFAFSIPNYPLCCYTAETQKTRGVEAELSGQLTRGWWLSGSYTFNVNRNYNGTALSSGTPRHLFKIWTDYTLPGNWSAWSAGGGLLAQSASYISDSICEKSDPLGFCDADEVPYRVTQGFYVVATARVAYRVDSSWHVSLTLNNIFDRRYYQTIGSTINDSWYGEPRNFMFTVEYKL